MTQTFFDKPLEHSEIKSQIVAKYFDAWSRIVSPRVTNVEYVDLFAGQGYYEDGTESTPLLVLKKAIENPSIARKLISEFNDQNSEYIKSLDLAIRNLDRINTLRYRPKLSSESVTKKIVEQYEQMNLPPTLFFLDPWGYKGVSQDLIRAAIKSWASECILFFNYKRINMDLQKSSVDKNINDFFGIQRANKLRTKTKHMSPYKREETIIGEFCKALIEMGGRYALPFCFRDRIQDRTSHYLIHASKHPLGYGLMKEIMNEYSFRDADGVPTFTFDPKQQLTLNFGWPLRVLEEQLVQEFKGQKLKVGDIYKKHQEKTRFVKGNYKDALLILEKESKIKVDIPVERRPIRNGKRTLGDNRIVTFISRGR
jgi:three-Cys-motif partner protein